MFSWNRVLASPDLSVWDTLALVNARGMFSYCYQFNTNSLENWNTAALQDASYMFASAKQFDGSLAGWDPQSITTLEGFMLSARSFNQNSFGGWTNTNNLQNMAFTFRDAISFNQPVPFQTSAVTTFQQCFDNAISFNQPLNWDVSSAIGLYYMFRGAVAFDQSVSGFDVTGVELLSGMFQGATNFTNGGDVDGLSQWNTASASDMSSMFEGTSGNWNLNGWNVERVQSFNRMFAGNAEYRGTGIETWITSRASDMNSMFEGCLNFVGDVSGFQTQNVESMVAMFRGADQWTSDISAW